MAKKYKTRRQTRLASEFERIKELTNRSSKINFKILHEERSSSLPDKYEITYKLKSITGINEDKSPKYGEEHKMQITLPPGWPAAGSPPDYYILTDIWHPNIKSTDPYKGHVCINSKAIATHEGLDDLVVRIGELLQWKNYLAEDKPPYPEDTVVAEWVREYAEPKGIVNLEKEVSVDYSDLLDEMADKATGGIEIIEEEVDEIIIIEEDDNKNDDISGITIEF